MQITNKYNQEENDDTKNHSNKISLEFPHFIYLEYLDLYRFKSETTTWLGKFG